MAQSYTIGEGSFPQCLSTGDSERNRNEGGVIGTTIRRGQQGMKQKLSVADDQVIVRRLRKDRRASCIAARFAPPRPSAGLYSSSAGRGFATEAIQVRMRGKRNSFLSSASVMKA